MSTSHHEIIKPSYPFELKGSPCKKCIVQSTCTKSFIDKTACKEYEHWVLDIIEQEKSGETKK